MARAWPPTVEAVLQFRSEAGRWGARDIDSFAGEDLKAAEAVRALALATTLENHLARTFQNAAAGKKARLPDTLGKYIGRCAGVPPESVHPALWRATQHAMSQA